MDETVKTFLACLSVYLIISIIAAVVILSAIILSSKISREEEDKGIE